MPVRTPQQERRRRTRERLLAASVECLTAHGYAGMSTTLVQETAGVSRGAQLHHFPTKAELIAATMDHMVVRLGEQIRADAASLPAGPERVRAVVTMLARYYASPLAIAATELWMAARTDPELARLVLPQSRTVSRECLRVTATLLGVDLRDPRTRELLELTQELLRGLGLSIQLRGAAKRDRLLDAWAAHLQTTLAPGLTANRQPAVPPSDLAREPAC